MKVASHKERAVEVTEQEVIETGEAPADLFDDPLSIRSGQTSPIFPCP